MNPVPNRKKLRREYLNKKFVSQGMSVGVCLCIILATLTGVLSLVIAAVGLIYHSWHSVIHLFIQSFVFFILSAMNLFITVRIRKKMLARLKETTYVPPVTPATLPVEEVLVRGAEEPMAPNETLLRATVKGEEAKAEELLRSHLP